MSFVFLVLCYLLATIPWTKIIFKFFAVLLGKRLEASHLNLKQTILLLGPETAGLASLTSFAVGFLPPWIASCLDFSYELQILAGILSVLGYYHPFITSRPFLKGIPTAAGFLLFISPELFKLLLAILCSWLMLKITIRRRQKKKSYIIVE